jgi:rhodanese-related sulfurtransferase
MTATQILGNAAVILGIGAAFAGSPYSERHGRIDVDQLANIVRHEDDHVTATELASWIKDRRPGLRVVDVRSAEDYDAFHVPSAERVPIDSLVAARFAPTETIVLYSEGGPHAAQAWVFLRALGYEKVYFLRGGVYEWIEQIVSPTLPIGATPKDSAAVDSLAALSRYFGGTPKRGVPNTADDAIAIPRATTDSNAAKAVGLSRPSAPGAVAKIRRRGC